MADTRVQRRVEEWIVERELPAIYGASFSKRTLSLSWGGVFEFDAVSADGKIVACISTSGCRTATGRNAVGKYHKIRADALYLLHAIHTTKLALPFTDPGMLAHFEKERARGRFPPADVIELRLVTLPATLAADLQLATRSASVEVSPST